jgi:phospholipid transport system substrate-binding protein
MNARFLSAAFAALLIAFSATAAWATPTDYVKKKTGTVTSILQKPDSKKRQKTLHEVLEQTIDFRELASRALGEHWKARTPEEQQEFLDLLQELLQANYEGKLEGSTLGEDYEIKYTEEKTRGDKAIVKTIVVTKKEKKPVDYKLVKKDSGWTIFDVVIDDISLEETYRESYTAIIEKEGWDSLIQRMKDKAKELRAQGKNKEKKEEKEEK